MIQLPTHTHQESKNKNSDFISKLYPFFLKVLIFHIIQTPEFFQLELEDKIVLHYRVLHF